MTVEELVSEIKLLLDLIENLRMEIISIEIRNIDGSIIRFE